MAEYSVLPHAPITEALIDIRVKLPLDFKVDKLDTIHGSISEQYPARKESKERAAVIEFKKGESPKLTKEGDKLIGYRYTSSDKLQVIQTRIDGFTFSRLKPYETWEQFHEEACRLWQLYKDITTPELITRVALRYINKINIPLPMKDFSEYLTASPIVPKGLPQGVSSFLTRTVISEPSTGSIAVISQALEKMVDPNFAPIILDIDVFKQKSDGIKEEDVWKIVKKLRDFKNKIFFRSITKKLKELFL